jgi:hypothetical protein
MNSEVAKDQIRLVDEFQLNVSEKLLQVLSF